MAEMKLHFIAAHERVGPMRKQFGVKRGENLAYPNASKLTSFEESAEVSAQGLRDYHSLLRKHAAQGHALYKGLFSKRLNNESRKGKTIKDSPSHLLVIDVDDLPTSNFKKGMKTPAHVIPVAEQVIQQLPTELHNVSYIVVASSSFGLNSDKVSVHIHMMLERPVMPNTLKSWLSSLNYTQSDIHDQITLTPSKMHVKSIIDPCLAEPSRIVYIAPPHFGPYVDNPFSNDEQRIILVEKKQPLLALHPLLDTLSTKIALVEEKKSALLAKLQRAAGIKKKQRTRKKFMIEGQPHFVVTNPEPLLMEVASFDDQYVRYNIGGGDSNAYWVRRDNPEIVYCFKPDEEPFMFSKAAPRTYQEHIEEFGEGYSIQEYEDGMPRKIRRMMCIEQFSDNYITIEYDEENDEVMDYHIRRSVITASEWMKFHGQIIPDPVPAIYQEMNPQDSRGIYQNGDRTYINTFKPTPYMRLESDGYELDYGTAWVINNDCPTIFQIIFHMLGADMESFEHFFNWLAFIFQTRKQTKTAWLCHGAEGTGKGLFFNLVLRPLLGNGYCGMNTLAGIIDDQYNGWLAEMFLLVIDEFNIKSVSGSSKKTISTVKNLIGEPTVMVRKMQQQQREMDNNLNLIMFTNDHDAMAISDRRRFNIPPRQEYMLDKRLPLVTLHPTQFDKLVASELPSFAKYLNAFKYDHHNAMKIIESDIREDVIKAGMSASDQFMDNIIHGNFAAFADLLDKPEVNLNATDFMELKFIKGLLRSILPFVNTQKECFIHKEDARRLYAFLLGKPVNINAFGKILNSTGAVIKRRLIPVGYLKEMSTRPRCISVVWDYPDEKELNEIKAAHTSVNDLSTFE